MSVYFVLAIVWIVLCLAIGLYISGIGFKEKSHYTTGFATIGISYLIGVCLLLGIIIFFK